MRGEYVQGMGLDLNSEFTVLYPPPEELDVGLVSWGFSILLLTGGLLNSCRHLAGSQ